MTEIAVSSPAFKLRKEESKDDVLLPYTASLLLNKKLQVTPVFG
jgi:hypothetical protein